MFADTEQWTSVPSYEGLYEISTLGRVRSIKRNRLLKPDSRNSVQLYKDTVGKGWQLNVLMGCAFLGNDIEDEYRHRVLFKDGNSSNLSLSNLYVEDTSDLPGEIWKPIVKAKGKHVQQYYQISNLGRVKSIKHAQEWDNYGHVSQKYEPDKILGLTTNSDGYKTIWLSTTEKPDIVVQVHRLVAAAFCKNDDPEHKIHVNHIDGNPSNNIASNLEWCTRSENVQHAIRTGLKKTFHRTLRYPVKRLETGEIFKSVSDVDRAMCRSLGYCAEAIEHGHICRDVNGQVWTLEIMKDVYQYIPGDGMKCYFEEDPETVYISLTLASRALGRWDGYLSEYLKRGKEGSKITSPDGKEWHLHIVEE